jgi:hypothetical protein
MAENQEILDSIAEQTVAAFQGNTEEPMAGFTADDLAKARAQEKAKLYPQMEKMAAELAALKKAQDDEAAAKSAKEAEREAAKVEMAKKKDEEELSAKELLAKKEQEWNSQIENERLERERAFALLQKEQELNQLNNYRQARTEQERDNIVPELIDLISGNTQDEVEESIGVLREKSQSILHSAQAAMQTAKQQMAGTRITAPASGPLDNDSEQNSYTPDSIRDMSLADYAKQRAKLLGTAASNRGQGLFG